MSWKIHLIAAARPNFMKIAPIWRAMSVPGSGCEPVLIHTGQHYDKNMSDVFFRDLGLPAPDIHLGVGGGSHAEQTAGVMLKFEKLCQEQRPDLVVVVGDVNATMATSIVASKLHIPVAQVVAGLRSRDMTMPEEINRLLTDSIADLLLTPSPDANDNLRAEGVADERIRLVGNVMIDSLVNSVEKARALDTTTRFGVDAGAFGVVTLHRPANVDDPKTLASILAVLVGLELPLIFPVHPRTRKVMADNDLENECGMAGSQVRICDALGYYDFMNLMVNARLVLTDSGGLQEETTYLGIPCLTLRPNTERPVTIDQGTNELVTVDTLAGRVQAVLSGNWKKGSVPDLWDGATGPRIVAAITGFLENRGGD